MSGPEPEKNATPAPGELPITEELANLKQVADMLRCVEELGNHGDFEDDTGMIVDVIKAARRMIEEVIAAFKALLRCEGWCVVSRKRFGKEELSAEVRQMQKAAAELACIQLTAEYDNEVAADLADAVAAVRAMVVAVAARLEAVISQSGKEGD